MSKTTKTILWLAAAIIVVGGFWWVMSGQNKTPAGTAKENIKIGVILPLTGPIASQGVSAKNAIEMAVEEQNSKGGVEGRKIKLIVEDTGLSPEKAVSAFNKLYNIDKVKFILGPLSSGEIAAVAPVIAKNDAIMINFGGGSSPYSKYGKNAFTTTSVFGYEVPRMVEYMEKQGYKNIAFLGVKADSTIQMEEILKKELQNKNITLAQSELMEANNRDFRTILLKFNKINPDAIYLIHYPVFMSMILKEMKELGIKTPVLTAANFEDPSIQENGIDLLRGIAYTSPVRQKEGEKYFEKYESKYGKKPVVFSDNAYDAANLLMNAIAKNDDINKVRKYLENVKNYDGAGGVFTIDKNRDAERDYVVKVYNEN